MFGTFQQSNLRIELNASEQQIRDSLLCPAQFQQWLFPQTFSTGLPDRLHQGLVFTSWIGPVPIQHQVDHVNSNSLRFLMSKGIDGFHEWYWGDGWLQSSLEGVSLLPLNLGQTLSLLRLRQFLAMQQDNADRRVRFMG
ncbi:hypothetical protein [Thermocoleostomius sinensis]|jgi:hypothetical protein|uniref:Uncharacterized protein n=1 Tax=Thermocoleostomius sinensis A174 TaxID=2016057 RepID=A0A9E8ZGC1_9CYAN|nr:hypothetical protein [Thermocoleostomius sinensis]WAL62919.1 hypothetical protein OXH18_24810 [Thermocoleostomius sinensis A174]